MKFVIREGDNRFIYRRAKRAFSDHFHSQRGFINAADEFWDKFGMAHNMKVIITEWQGPFPVVKALEFNTEADYAWFMLRYS